MAGLEGSFAQLMNRHSHRQVVLSNHLERAKREAIAAATNVSGLLVESVNGGVQESFVNEQRIETEARALVGTVQRFTKQSVQWLTVFHTFDSALKVWWSFGVQVLQCSGSINAPFLSDSEIGDFENWIRVMEYDLESIGSALGYLSSAAGGK